ncbi:grasp-with-spasm system SPASM domain peptide maturase [Chryseobacterium chendengshani]|uniref:grasp-with-spasm system SPASM domain peptide maturase n=1 Tax=Chryseobacterium sp. LJ756 TaxID=2864113 RepID=UPI001C63CA27|nr:grasp-with-spasm system SPASM domain peptide maturase [Chryseobacterium sp. LJ756]MBW7675217.1 grasp-with-spasm system SPASM domain peptide maturase [Chryseobacterium sp. LJ756]
MYFLKADLIPCKGYSQTTLIDVVNSQVFFFDNKFFEILHELYYYGKAYIEEELFEILSVNNFIIIGSQIEEYPRLDIANMFNSIFFIENCIIDRNKNSTYDILNILKQLDYLHCKYIQFRFFDYTSDLYTIIKYLNDSESFIQNVEIIIKKPKASLDKISNLFYQNLRVNKLVLFGGDKTEVLENLEGRIFYETQSQINDSKSCGFISLNNFYINKYHFKEANNVNSCLHKKISIDSEGNIRNCPSMPQSFGNINDTTLEEALNHKDFKKYWNLPKDKIEVCKDCEFRYICTDCRAYTERTHEDNEGLDISKPLKCGYDPYTGEWEEWSTNPLKDKAIKYYGMQELVKKN